MNHTEPHLRITFVLPFAGMAGGIRVIAIYAQRLQQRGHQVRVISMPWWPAGRLARAKSHVHEFMERIALRPRDPSHLDGLDVEHIQLKQTRPVTNADVPDGDVVVATWWETAPWVANLSPEKGAKAYFVQDYGAHEGQPLEQVATTWRLPMHKIVISRWLMGLIAQQAGPEYAAEAVYVPNAVDCEQFNAPPRGKQRRPTFGFVYSTGPQKGCDLILQSLNRAKQRFPDMQVLAFGPGTPGPEFPGPMPLGSRYFGRVADHKLREIYSACDGWLFGSRIEGFGLPILEAMACRTPVIATPAGAAPDLLEHGGGILVRPDDVASMATAIEGITVMSDLQWREMSDAAHAMASRHSWDEATDRFEAALHKAVAEQHATALAAV